MASDINVVNVLSQPQINTLIPGNFFAVFTPSGTKIIDVKNLNYVQQNSDNSVNLINTLSATDIDASGTVTSDTVNTVNLTLGGTDISNIYTTLINLSTNLLTTVSQVSSSIIQTTPNVYIAYALVQFPVNTRISGIGQFYTDPTQVTGSPVPSNISNFWNSDFNIAYLSNSYSLSSKLVLLGSTIVTGQSLSALFDLGQSNTSGVTLSAEVRVIKYY